MQKKVENPPSSDGVTTTTNLNQAPPYPVTGIASGSGLCPLQT